MRKTHAGLETRRRDVLETTNLETIPENTAQNTGNPHTHAQPTRTRNTHITVINVVLITIGRGGDATRGGEPDLQKTKIASSKLPCMHDT